MRGELGGGWFPGTVEQWGEVFPRLAGERPMDHAEGDRDTPESPEAGGQILGSRP